MHKKGASAPFLLACDFRQERQKLRSLVRREPRGHAPFVRPDAALEVRDQRAAGSRKKQSVRAPVLPAVALHEAAGFQPVEHADERGTVEADRLREPRLGHARIRVEDQKDPHAPGRQIAYGLAEVAEHRLLREAQSVAEKPGQ